MGKRKLRQNELMRIILKLGYVPKNQSELAELLHVSVRTVQRDINEIKEMLPKVCLDDMKEQAFLQLRGRVPNLKDSDLIRLFEFFVPKKRDIKFRGESEVHVKIWSWSEKNSED